MDFVVLKVNGKDVSSASHEDTIAAFTTAKEPIIVEVLKRPPRQEHMGSEPVSILCDTSTQTEWTGAVLEQPSAGLSSYGESLVQHSSATHSSFTPSEVITNHYSTIAGDPDGEEDDGCDVEYEEVILHREPQDAKLGLTLCYGSPDEPDTDIYISEVEPDSIAGKDGRIQEGDQLLQINGVDVRSRDQAVSLFSEKRSDFVLLLARPQMPVDEYVLEDQYTTDFPDCNMLLDHEEYGTTDTGTTENALNEKDSGVGRTDESTKNDESSDHEAAEIYSILEDMKRDRQTVSRADGLPASDTDTRVDSNSLKDNIRTYQSQISGKGMTLAPLCRFQSDASLDREMALLNKEMENIQLECETLVHRHMETQQKGGNISDASKCQLEHVYVNLTELQAAKNSQDPAFPLSKKETVERWVNSMFLSKKCTTFKQDQDSSSAYNTAESSGSGPLTLELTPMSNRYDEVHGSVMSLVSPKMEDKGTQLRDSDAASMFSCDSCRRCCKALVERESMSSLKVPGRNAALSSPKNFNQFNSGKTTQNKAHSTERDSTFDRMREERNKNYVSFFPAPNTMYTNQANLQHTIWLQQQMLRQAMTQQKVSKSCGSIPWSNGPNVGGHRGVGLNTKLAVPPATKIQGQSSHGHNSYHLACSSSKGGTLSTVKEDEEMKMEWKVKRRADGTRYITRRPVRNRLLKARAMKILEERAGITTDDDAMSELKTGRYWSKEERKRHLEKARDRKRKEMIIRSKISGVKEPGDEGEDGKKEINILELSHKKMMKRRGKVVFDDFTTIQEVLAHGAKVSSSGSKPLGLLTVTTV